MDSLFKAAATHIADGEAWINHIYLDSKGNATTGYGFNITHANHR
jgi:hypothetical protein